jgi:hypothetical protein
MESNSAGNFLLTIEGCLFEDNVADEGGGIACTIYSYPTIIGCTFVGNGAPTGAAVLCHEGGSPVIEQTVLAFSTQGPAVDCTGYFSDATLVCCDIYGNEGGDWVGCIADQYAVDGNFSKDPLFCDMYNDDVTLCANSPCLPGGNDCGVLIGARGAGCQDCSNPVELKSWGAIKATYE